MVENFFRKFIANYPPTSFYLLEFAIHDLKSQIRNSRPFEREWQPIFDVYVELSILIKSWPYIEPLAQSNMQNRVVHFLNDYRDELNDHLNQLSSKPRMFAADPFYEEIMMRVQHFYFDMENLVHYRKQVYLSFWDSLVTTKTNECRKFRFLEDTRNDRRRCSFKYGATILLLTFLYDR